MICRLGAEADALSRLMGERKQEAGGQQLIDFPSLEHDEDERTLSPSRCSQNWRA